MTTVDSQGIDSAIWKYSSTGLNLTIDLGLYSEKPAKVEEDPDYKEERRRIDGKRAVIILGRNFAADAKNHPYIAAVYFSNIGLHETKLSFFATCVSANDQQTAKRIFLSIRFAKMRQPHAAKLNFKRTGY